MAHLERHGWVKQISRINEEINDSEAIPEGFYQL